jgi:hypothetical protein
VIKTSDADGFSVLFTQKKTKYNTNTIQYNTIQYNTIKQNVKKISPLHFRYSVSTAIIQPGHNTFADTSAVCIILYIAICMIIKQALARENNISHDFFLIMYCIRPVEKI